SRNLQRSKSSHWITVTDYRKDAMPLPDQLQKGFTYADGDVVNAAGLNALVDQATVLVGAITEQGTLVDATDADQVLINRGGALKRARVDTLPSGVSSVAMTILSPFHATVTHPTGAVEIDVWTPD